MTLMRNSQSKAKTPSTAHDNLNERLKDIDQLFNAHTAITKFNNAQKAASKAGGELGKVSKIVEALVTEPGKGKPKEVDAINRAAYVLLIAHFQGFIEELHTELGMKVLKGKTTNPEAVIKLVKPSRSNPHFDIINQMFSGIGVYEIMDSINWQKCSNKTVKSRLTKCIETRNKIAHGNKVPIVKTEVVQLKKFILLLSEKIDEHAAKKAKDLIA